MHKLLISNSHQSGVTVTELLVVVIVISVMAGFALLNRGSADQQLTRSNSAQHLKASFERARYDSVKRRAECDPEKAKVVVNSGLIVLWTDKDNSGLPDAGETESIDISPHNVTISGIGLTLPVTVTFNQRGEPSATDGVTTSNYPGFYVCNGVCSGTPTNSDANKVYITPTGTVNLMGGGESLPTFGVPGGTAIGTGVEINDSMLLPSATGCGGP
jgi:prepilin-type N-terminal cleavage/methylation domain-containing protein